MSSVVELYEALSTAPDDRTRARVIAEAFERLEDRYPHLPDLATQGHVRESELRLQKEIEQVQANLRLEIEQLRSELHREVEQIRADLKIETERLRGEIAHLKFDLLKWLVPLMLGQIAAIAALVKLL